MDDLTAYLLLLTFLVPTCLGIAMQAFDRDAQSWRLE